jgi:hypothetical protein
MQYLALMLHVEQQQKPRFSIRATPSRRVGNVFAHGSRASTNGVIRRLLNGQAMT